MFLYLVQHGEAKRQEEDPERGLTDKGFRDIARTALSALERRVQVSRIVHSGKKRAGETANVLNDRLKPPQGAAAADGLAPMDDPAYWAERLAGMEEDVLLVGHLPHLARLASLLLCGNGDTAVVDFTMAGMVCLRRSPEGRWSVNGMFGPETAGSSAPF